MTDWVPNLAPISGPRYLAFVLALDADIAAGPRQAGHAAVAPTRHGTSGLALSVGTVSKAYTEAEQRGLISGEVGRGTLRSTSPAGAAPRARHLRCRDQPRPQCAALHRVEDDVIASTIGDILVTGEMGNLLGYLPHQGLRRHREAMVSWLASLGVAAEADQIFITHGGQHALSIAVGSGRCSRRYRSSPRSFTYSGMLALSVQNNYHLHGVATDAGRPRAGKP